MLLEVTDVTKRYGGVHALGGASLDIAPGEVHGLIGANGAGKSTLLKIISGLIKPNSGTVAWAEEAIDDGSEDDRIGLVMQESQLCEGMSVGENIELGKYPLRMPGLGIINKREMHRAAAEILESVGVDVPPRAPVSGLSLARRRMVEVAKALARNPRLLILDEPTTALGSQETSHLLDLMGRVSKQGVAVIFVTHRLAEVVETCDRVTVLRNGATVETLTRDETSVDRLVEAMSGEEPHVIVRTAASPGRARLRLTDLSGDRFKNVDMTVRSAECTVVTGLVGSGRSSVLRAIVGLAPSTGSVEVEGSRLRRRNPRIVARHGARFLPEDRGLGLLSTMSVLDNLILPMLASGKGSRWSLLRRRHARRRARALVEEFGIKVADLSQPIQQLSGGNQQKVMFAACMSMSPHLLLVDEPTQGVDIRAKAEIHRMLLEFVNEGGSILGVISEPEECMEVGDRLLIMRGGEIAGELPGDRVSKAAMTRLAFGHIEEDQP